MRNTFIPILVLVAALGLLLLILGCPEERDNPLDPGADLPDPFQMQASLTPDGVQIEWHPVKVRGVEGYRVYRSTQAASAGIPVGEVGTTVTSYLDRDGYANTTYWYRIVALDSEGEESEASQPDSVTVTGARLSTSPSSWSAGAAKDSLRLHIISDSTICRFNYTIASDSGWLTVSKTSGTAPDSVWMKVAASSSSTSRTGRVIVTALGVAGTPDTIAVTQYPSGAEPVLVIAPDSVRLPGMGGTSDQIQITIVNGTNPAYSVASSDTSWLKVSKSSGTTPDFFTVTAVDNITATPRHGFVTAIANDCAPETLKVYQPRMGWSPLGSGMGYGAYSHFVTSLVEQNGRLIAGGLFISAGGLTANMIASWDGVAWSPVGSGLNSFPWTLTDYYGKLVAGGNFDTAGGVAASYIASWNGNSWSPLGSGISGADDVHALCLYDGKLIAGGKFDSAGGAAVNNIASWNGSSWSPLGSGFVGENAQVFALSVYNGKLIAGGEFSSAGGVYASNIASWNGTNWSPIGSGVNYYGRVFALTVYNGELIAGGCFSTAGGNAVQNIAAWNGEVWTALASGNGGGDLNSGVSSLTVYGGRLVVGGDFTVAGEIIASNIAIWDGTTWSALAGGMNYDVSALTQYDGSLIAGGWFSIAGGVPCNNIAILKEQD